DAQAMAVLGKYVPAIAGIAASGDPEMGVSTLDDISHKLYLPFQPEMLEKAIEELTELIVE
ncbi:MAG: hypothetical protein K2P66_02485, partial [Lachnospiraceae bacterium]|nr:hypothetical protein [Lachnospiraceae bacterium]